MEDENKIVNEKNNNINEKKSAKSWTKNHILLLIILLAIVIAAIIGIVLLVNNKSKDEEEETSKKPEDAVEAYIEGMGSGEASKVLDAIDLKGTLAWSNCDGDPEKFEEEYKSIDEENEDVKEQLEYAEESMNFTLDSINSYYVDYELKITEVNNVEEIADDLYQIKAKIETITKDSDGDESSGVQNAIFIVYKDKVINME